MSVTIKSPREKELMREAGKILAQVHNELGKIIKPGISTYEIDKEGEYAVLAVSLLSLTIRDILLQYVYQ